MAILLAVAVFLLVKVIKSRKEYRDTELPEIIIEHKTGKISGKRISNFLCPPPCSRFTTRLGFGEAQWSQARHGETAENQGKVEVEKAEDLAVLKV